MQKIWLYLKNKPGLTVFLLALAIRLLALWAAPESWQTPLKKDALLYHSLAVSLSSGNGLVHDGNFALVSPLYPLFLSGIYQLFGLDRFCVLLAQCLLGALLVLYVYRIGAAAFSPEVARTGALVAAVYWPLVAIGLKISSEALFIPMLAAAVYYTILAFQRRLAGWAIAGAVLLGLASLTRTAAFYFPAIVIIYCAFAYRSQKDKRLLVNTVLYVVIFFITLFPWALRNHARLGHFIFTSTNSGMVLSSGNMPRQGKIFGFNWRKKWLEPSKRHILDLPEIQRDRALKKMAVDHLRKHPERIPRLLLLKTMYFFSLFDWEVLGHENGVFNPWFFWVLLFAMLGLFNLKWKQDHFLPAGAIIYLFALSLVAYASSRLRLPVDPFFILFASAGWLAAEKRLGSRWKALILLFVVLVSSAAGYIYSDLVKESCRSILVLAGIW